MDVKDCTKCSELVDNRSCIVNGVGKMESKLMIIGEAPGEQEDKEGRPFVGKSGKKLRKTLEENGINPSDIRITNTVRCKPPNNRDPKEKEKENCREYLNEEIEKVNPDLIIGVGKTPCEELLERKVSSVAENGDVNSVEIRGETYDFMVGIHPAASMYNPDLDGLLQECISKASDMCNFSGGQSELRDF